MKNNSISKKKSWREQKQKNNTFLSHGGSDMNLNDFSLDDMFLLSNEASAKSLQVCLSMQGGNIHNDHGYSTNKQIFCNQEKC